MLIGCHLVTLVSCMLSTFFAATSPISLTLRFSLFKFVWQSFLYLVDKCV